MSEYTTCAECCGKGSLAGNTLCAHCEGTGRVCNTTQLLERKMRVAIVGCLGRQEKIIEEEIYDNLDIRFANRGAKYGISDLDILKRVDRIFVMSKFISHTLTQNLDRSKTTLIHGGFNTLKNALATLNASVRIDAPQLTHSEEDDDMARDGYNFNDQMRAAKEGDVLVFVRPPDHTMKKWENKVSAMRGYNKERYGMITVQETKGDEVHVLVESIRKPKTPLPRTAEPTTFNELLESTKQMDAIVEGAQPASRIHRVYTAEDRAFWRQVFILSMQQNPGMAPNQHIAVANQALQGSLAAPT